MPEKKYEPFTKEEKAEIIRRHKELVDQFNERLPDGNKLKYDEELEQKLDNPETIALYRIGQQIKEIQDKQKAIHTALEAKYGASKEAKNPIGRSLVYAFKVEDTDEAKKYNEKLYRDYIEDPNKVAYQRCKNLLDTNFADIYNLQDDKQKLAQYFLDTYPLCEEAYVFDGAINNGKPTPEMKVASKSMKKPLEVLAYPRDLVRNAHELDYFAFPKMSAEQSSLIQLQGGELMLNISPTIKSCLDNAMAEEVMDKPYSYFGKFIEHGIELNKETLLKYKPVQRIEQNGQVKFEEVSYDQFFKHNNGDISIQERSEEEIFQIKCINKSFQAQYMKKWDKKFQEKAGEIGDFNMAAIEDRHKGGFIERYILHSTSREYKEMIQAMKDIHDPSSPKYGNKFYAKEKARLYLDHKHNKGYHNIEQARGTDKIRMQLALNVINACDETSNFEEIENEWFKENEVQVEAQKEQIVVKEAADEKENDIQKMKENIEEELEVEEDLNMTK